MFATQLLRILQTIPSDVKHETCVYDSAAQDMIMKENQNGTTHYDSKSFGRDSDPLAVGSKEMYRLNGLRRDTHPSLFEAKGTEECWKPKTEDDLSMDNQNRTRDSTAEEFRNDPLSSDTNAKDKVKTRPEHDPPAAGGEFMHCNENESGRLPYVAASDLFERDKNLFTDKNVLEFEHPELIVCYKEINYHVVKDICVDEGVPASRKFLIDSSKDNQSGNSFPQALNDNNHHKANGAVDEELLISNGLKATSLVNTEFIIANQQGSKKESNGIKLVTQGWPKLPSESTLYKDTATGSNLEESMQKGGTNFGASSKTATHASDVESFVDRALPIQEFGTRSFLRSFLNSLDGEGNKVMQLPDQFSSGRVVSEGPAATSTEAGAKEDVQASILCYNSKVETRSITFNFNSLAPAVGGITSGKTEHVEEQSLDSREVIDQKDAEADILSDSRPVQRGSKDTSPGDIPDQSINKDGFPNDFAARSQAQSVSSNDDEKSADLSLKSHQLASSKSVNPVNSGGQATSSHVLQHEDRDPNNDPVVSLRRYDQGESSFSADDFILHSGPMAFSGSISLRSDGSATSGRSFAFPILQAEWSSSPVRMTEADRRRFRKHKGWRSGLLCCRF